MYMYRCKRMYALHMYNPPPQLSRLGTLCPTLLLYTCLFVSSDGGFLGFFLLLSILLL